VVCNVPIPFPWIFWLLVSLQAIDRLSTQRAPAKREAEKFIPYYKLGLGKECEERVESLFLHHAYVFPGTWGSGEHDSNTVCDYAYFQMYLCQR
jgi:hypothetical protein